MGLLAFVILGVIAGFIASLITGTNGRNGLLADLVFGVVGSIIGGFIFSLFGVDAVNGLNFPSLIVATIGAVIAIMIYRSITSTRV